MNLKNKIKSFIASIMPGIILIGYNVGPGEDLPFF